MSENLNLSVNIEHTTSESESECHKIALHLNLSRNIEHTTAESESECHKTALHLNPSVNIEHTHVFDHIILNLNVLDHIIPFDAFNPPGRTITETGLNLP